jgi:Kef-type K+ transport system membrane component KefB
MKPSRWFLVVNILTSIFFYLSLMDIALIYLCVYAFGVIGRGTSHDIMTVAVMFMIVIIPTVIWKVKTRVRMLSKYRKEALFTILMLMLWLGVCIGGVISLRDVCVCVYNHNYGVSIGPG